MKTKRETKTAPVLLGQGELSWRGSERRSDRYGTVGLFTQTDRTFMGNESYGDELKYVLVQKFEEQTGTLVAEVVETRQSLHIGDIFRGIFPSVPEVGERITLGTGEFFVEREDARVYVGLKPEDGRDSDWLDPKALYRCHQQTVQLWFEVRP